MDSLTKQWYNEKYEDEEDEFMDDDEQKAYSKLTVQAKHKIFMMLWIETGQWMKAEIRKRCNTEQLALFKGKDGWKLLDEISTVGKDTTRTFQVYSCLQQVLKPTGENLHDVYLNLNQTLRSLTDIPGFDKWTAQQMVEFIASRSLKTMYSVAYPGAKSEFIKASGEDGAVLQLQTLLKTHVACKEIVKTLELQPPNQEKFDKAMSALDYEDAESMYGEQKSSTGQKQNKWYTQQRGNNKPSKTRLYKNIVCNAARDEPSKYTKEEIHLKAEKAAGFDGTFAWEKYTTKDSHGYSQYDKIWPEVAKHAKWKEGTKKNDPGTAKEDALHELLALMTEMKVENAEQKKDNDKKFEKLHAMLGTDDE